MELSRFFSKDWYSRLKPYVESPEFEEIAAFEIDPVERPTGDEGISALHLSDDGNTVAALTEDGRLRIWRTE